MGISQLESSPCIEVNHLHRSFRSVKRQDGLKGALQVLFNPEHTTHQAVTDVSFSIPSGEFVGLIGANGAGKTTLLKILSGLIPPTAGTASVLGFTPFDRDIRFRRSISLVMGQKAQLWWDLPAKDAFELIQAIYDIPVKTYLERLDSFAKLLDVTRLLQTQIRRLSLGERMKMELIGALLHWPKVIFLDEPTIGLDVMAAQKLREFLKWFNQSEKATIILTSHNMDDIEKLCSRVLILKDGKMIFDGNPRGLTQTDQCVARLIFKEDPSVETVEQKLGMPGGSITRTQEENHPPTLFIPIKKEQIASVLQKLLQHYTMVDMGIESQSLESVISRLYHEGQIQEVDVTQKQTTKVST